MSIKKMDMNLLNKMMSSDTDDTVETNIDESEISLDDLSALYELGMKDLENLKVMLVVSQLDIVSSCFSPIFEISEPIKEYFKYMLFLCEEVLPKLLKGDIDDIIGVDEGIEGTDMALHEMRENIYKILKEKQEKENN